jgi:cystathionine beta-lyase/cystathionine gamma-synthase
MRFDTKLVHAGEPRPRYGRAIVTPIFQSSTFEYGGAADYHDIGYLRLSNTPNHDALHGKLAALEGAEAALVTASGMAAISTALLAHFSAGDHVLVHDCLYGGTHDLFTRDLPRFGITCTFVDAARPDTWAQALRPTTRAFYVEAITNPTLEVVELDAVAEMCRARGLMSMIDATMASPVCYRPIERGFDLVVHSATKYLNGHSDLCAGVVAGRAPSIQRVKHTLDHLGGALDPHACFLLQRGLKTLALRVGRQSESSLALARFLASHPQVAEVHHPGLETHAGHERARRWFDAFGGMVSFRPRGGQAAAERFLQGVELAISAPSLGGPETLVTRPAATSHVGLPPEERARLRIGDDLVRVSVGLEAMEDLKEDFDRALRR